MRMRFSLMLVLAGAVLALAGCKSSQPAPVYSAPPVYGAPPGH